MHHNCSASALAAGRKRRGHVKIKGAKSDALLSQHASGVLVETADGVPHRLTVQDAQCVGDPDGEVLQLGRAVLKPAKREQRPQQPLDRCIQPQLKARDDERLRLGRHCFVHEQNRAGRQDVLARRQLRYGIAEPADCSIACKDDRRIDRLVETSGAGVQFEREGRSRLLVVRPAFAGDAVPRPHELETLKTGEVRRRLTGSKRQSFFDGRRVSVNHHVAPRLTSASGIWALAREGPSAALLIRPAGRRQ